METHAAGNSTSSHTPFSIVSQGQHQLISSHAPSSTVSQGHQQQNSPPSWGTGQQHSFSQPILQFVPGATATASFVIPHPSVCPRGNNSSAPPYTSSFLVCQGQQQQHFRHTFFLVVYQGQQQKHSPHSSPCMGSPGATAAVYSSSHH